MNEDFVIKDNVLIKYNGNDEIVIIPEGIKKIKEMCFFENTKIKEVSLPTTCKKIRENVFYGCKNLEYINLENVEYIGYGCFEDCKTLKEVKLSKNLEYIDTYAFRNSGIKEVNIFNVETIAENAFYECNSLKTIDIKNIGYIDNVIISKCNNLKKIKINAQEIGNSFVTHCINLEEIEIYNRIKYEETMYTAGRGNISLTKVIGPNIITEDGIVYDKNKTILIALLESAKNNVLNISDKVNTIISGAIYNNNYLEKIIINNDIKIECFGINNCENLREIKIKNKCDLVKNSISKCYKLNKIDLKDANIKIFKDETVNIKNFDKNTDIKVYLPVTIEEIDIANQNTKVYVYKKPKKITGYIENLNIITLEKLIEENKNILEINKIFKEISK